MRQPHPELNFRLGRRRIRERRKAFSCDSLAATCDFLGITGEEKEQFLAEIDAIRAGERVTCGECGNPLPSQSSDPTESSS